MMSRSTVLRSVRSLRPLETLRWSSTAGKPNLTPVDRKAAPQGRIQGRPLENYHFDKDNNVVIQVKPIERKGESLANMRKRLVYQSRKRGILETDLLLSRFADKYVDKLDESLLHEYDKFMDELDWDIYYWVTENYSTSPLPKKWENSKILKMLQEESKNAQGEILRMPNLK